MNKIVDYFTFTIPDLLKLDSKVHNFILKGWQPLGNPILTASGQYYLVTMVKYEQ